MKKIVSLFVVLFLISVASAAHAVVMGDGGFSVPTGQPSPGGTLIATITDPFSGIAGQIGGTITQNVLSNPNGMLFEYIINSTGIGQITQASASFFNGYTTDLDGPVLPHIPYVDLVTRSADGETVTWSYISNAMTTGQSSGTLWVQTNATGYTRGIFSLLGADTATLDIYAPLSRPNVVPEPASMTMLGLGLTGLVGSRMRRKFKA